MYRFANRAILGFIILALLFLINCTQSIKGEAFLKDFVGGFEGCFQGADSEGQPIILTLNSPSTLMEVNNAFIGSLLFLEENCLLLKGKLTSPVQAKLTGTGKVPITLTRTEDGGTVTMTVEFSNGSSLGPLERRGDPPEGFCPREPTECP